MKLAKLDVISREPCVLRFIFAQKVIFFPQLERFVETWLKGKRDSAMCDCTYRYAEFVPNDKENSMTLRSEWICESCAEALADAVQHKFPSLQKVELGLHSSTPSSEEPRFIQVPAKDVQFENGRRVAVASFSIAKRPVTVGEFEEFVHKTGYLTLAELRGSSETFRSHSGLNGLGSSRPNAPAQFIAHSDAEAFCRYVDSRLPSEAEWLAAAVLEPVEIELTPWDELQRKARPVPANALEVNNWDITATRLVEDKVVARRGPLYFLKKGWREQPLLNFNRRLIDKDEFDMSITFRLAK